MIFEIVKFSYSKFFVKDQFAWFGQFPKNTLTALKKKSYTYNGIVAYVYLANVIANKVKGS